jgi:hypothetical protein
MFEVIVVIFVVLVALSANENHGICYGLLLSLKVLEYLTDVLPSRKHALKFTNSSLEPSLATRA